MYEHPVDHVRAGILTRNGISESESQRLAETSYDSLRFGLGSTWQIDFPTAINQSQGLTIGGTSQHHVNAASQASVMRQSVIDDNRGLSIIYSLSQPPTYVPFQPTWYVVFALTFVNETISKAKNRPF